MSVGAGFARDDVFRPNRWLPKSETSYHLNARLGVRKRLVSFYSAGFAAIDPDVLLARRTRRAEWERVHRETVPLSLENFVSAVSGHRPNYDGEYGRQHSASIEQADREAWAWLEGSALLIKHPPHGEMNLVRALSRRAQRLALEPNPRRALSARRLPKDSLHPAIREEVWSLYHRGKYDTAVFEV